MTLPPNLRSISNPSRSRRLRLIDFWRGISLFAILLIHLPSSRLQLLQWSAWGFSDGAAVFFFLSGYLGYLADERIRVREGGAGTWRRTFRRLKGLYLGHLILAAVSVASIWALGRFGGKVFPLGRIDSSISYATAHPILAWLQEASLHMQLFCNDILPAFIILSIAATPGYALLRRSMPAFIGASACVWLAVQFIPELNLPIFGDPAGWVFNVFAWQLLFFGGSVAARFRDRLDGLRRLPATVWLMIAGFILAAGSVTRFELFPQPYSYYLSLMGPPADSKTKLAPIYLAHAGFVILIGYGALRNETILDQIPGAAVFESVGRHSLVVFVVSTASIYVSQAVITGFDLNGSVVNGLQLLLATLSLILAGWWGDRRSDALRRLPGPIHRLERSW